MRARSIFGLIFVVLYCGGLLYYFLGVGGSVKGAIEIGLGPTLLGLGVVGLLFAIPLIIALVRIIARPRSPRGGGGPDAPDGAFDADAVVARYLARQAAEAAAPPQKVSGPAKSGGFGRRSRGA